MQCSTVNLFTQLLSSRNWRKFIEFPQDTWACIKALHFTNGISNYFCTLLLKCFCHISSLINSQMHNKEKKLSKIILQSNVMLEKASQEKVCQTDKCLAHSDSKNCYGHTLMQTISYKQTSSVFISIKWHQIINLLSFSPLTAHMQISVSPRTFTFHDFYRQNKSPSFQVVSVIQYINQSYLIFTFWRAINSFMWKIM